jgi:hypothetical protein
MLRQGLQRILPITFFLFFWAFSYTSFCQDNYEIQVYGSQTIPKGKTMLELHSNFTDTQNKKGTDSIIQTDHAFHETIEITHGFTSWFEVGFYIFTAITPSNGFDWVGDHIRPRIRVPDSWNWPIGLSLSNEVGYQKRSYSPDTWTWEMRPIIDKTINKIYFSFNPTLGKSFRGANENSGFIFSPNFKIGYSISKKIIPGIEYYSSWGALNGFDAFEKQKQQIAASLDLNVSPDWELNFGIVCGITESTDNLIIKMIIGRRF